MVRTVTLVNETGTPLGEAGLLAAHTGKGQLHRAFSVYVFRRKREELLIQRRSDKKLLWPLIWANTCCSHPYKDESPTDAGERRLQEELGFSCALTPHSDFVYRAEDPGRGVEHEYVTILIGDVDQATVKPNADEVAQWQWINMDELHEDMHNRPDLYAPWFHCGLAKIFPAGE